MSVAEAQARQLQCFDSKEDAQRGCGGETPPPLCWVCIDGQPVQTTTADALAKGLKCYPSAQEAQKHCEPLCWCCIKDELFHITEAECRRRGGKCYRTREEAIRHCTEKRRWTCIDGKVVQTTAAECQAKGLQCYGSEQDAKAHCNPTPTPAPGDCWCCVDMPGGMGVANTTPADCEKRGTGVVGHKCYSSKKTPLTIAARRTAASRPPQAQPSSARPRRIALPGAVIPATCSRLRPKHRRIVARQDHPHHLRHRFVGSALIETLRR